MALGIKTEGDRAAADLGDSAGEEDLDVVRAIGVVVVEVDKVAVRGGRDGLGAVFEGYGQVGVEVLVFVVGVEGDSCRG